MILLHSAHWLAEGGLLGVGCVKITIFWATTTPICRVLRSRLFTLTFCGMCLADIEPRRPSPNSRPQPRGDGVGETRERERVRESRLPPPRPPSALSSCLFLAKCRRRRRRYFVRTSASDGCLLPLLPNSHVPQTRSTSSHATFVAKNECAVALLGLIFLSSQYIPRKGVLKLTWKLGHHRHRAPTQI